MSNEGIGYNRAEFWKSENYTIGQKNILGDHSGRHKGIKQHTAFGSLKVVWCICTAGGESRWRQSIMGSLRYWALRERQEPYVQRHPELEILLILHTTFRVNIV